MAQADSETWNISMRKRDQELFRRAKELIREVEAVEYTNTDLIRRAMVALSEEMTKKKRRNQ